MTPAPGGRHGWLVGWGVVVAVAYLVRGPVPIDETRYLSVAWEMWVRGEFLVPHLNGAPYSHKPPLVFWLFHLGWAGFGVNAWWPRLVGPLFALGAAAGAAGLARRLWPQRPGVARAVPWLLMGSLFWAAFTPMVMFDMPLAALALAAVAGVWWAGRERRAGLGWLVFTVAAGLGILTKGPVILLHVMFPALLAPWWSARARHRPIRWYATLVAAVLGAAAIALAWALPAARAGGAAYEQAILWHQTADRMVESFAHQRPWWWYLPWVPVLLFPWALWAPLWRGLGRLHVHAESGTRFCLAWVAPTFIAFCALSAKQPHYLLGLFPAAALLMGRALEPVALPAGRRAQWLPALGVGVLGAGLALLPVVAPHLLPPGADPLVPLWGVALVALAAGAVAVRELGIRGMAWLGLLTAALVTGAVFRATGTVYDLQPVARYVAELQERGVPVAHVGKYHGQYQFLGRLEQPLAVIPREARARWAAAHPAGYVIQYTEARPRPGDSAAALIRPYRGDWVVVSPAEASSPVRPVQ